MVDTAGALAEEGQPPETTWPYSFDQITPWVPPSCTEPPFKARMVQSNAGFNEVIQMLNQGFPVILGLVISDAFYRPNNLGIIPDRSPDIERGGHAVLAVGHGIDQKGERAVLIRNSWGVNWGIAGYAWLPQTYALRHLYETATVT